MIENNVPSREKSMSDLLHELDEVFFALDAQVEALKAMIPYSTDDVTSRSLDNFQGLTSCLAFITDRFDRLRGDIISACF